MIATLPLDLLACPTCHGTLTVETDGATCSACAARYELSGGIADLIPASIRVRLADLSDHSWDRWREAIRGLESWRTRRTALGSAGIARRDGVDDRAVREFFERARVHGTVVDVGAKDGARRALLPDGARYVGIDPFARAGGATRDGDTIVRGVAEALPLRDRIADAVISMAAFDYFADGNAAVEEMHRVMKPTGVLALMVSVVSSTVAHARGGRTRQSRLASAVRAVREVGVSAGAGLVGAALFERDRPHTHYYTHGQCTAMVAKKFDVQSVEEVRQAASTILYITATKRRLTRLPVLREGR